ncbi:unnamed protein product [Sphagnum jensenii]|uniref:Uncharacterized protein n=1 Tax=Sphagnum jensenii TaxID=128206 RepID=A0ABP1APQ7_9BRYO
MALAVSFSPSFSLSLHCSSPCGHDSGSRNKSWNSVHQLQSLNGKSIPPGFCVVPLRVLWPRWNLSTGFTCTAMDASISGAGPVQPAFPRVNVRDPYKRLGVSHDSSEEEIREARNYLSEQVAVSLAACIYLLHDRLKSLSRAMVLGQENPGDLCGVMPWQQRITQCNDCGSTIDLPPPP